MQLEPIEYNIRKAENLFSDLPGFEEYFVKMQKGGSSVSWRILGGIPSVISEIMSKYDDNKKSKKGCRSIKINLEGELLDNSEIKVMFKEIEEFANRKNGERP